MSWQPAKEPQAETPPAPAVDLVIEPRERDLGDGFLVRRVLPYAQHRNVGPFVFFDHFGPTDLPAGGGMDVRPHPHIGLATVTYLIEGEIGHRDSLGNDQIIRPGAVNWMTAGRGIAHSERTPPALRPTGSRLLGCQLWVALPQAAEEAPPSFTHRAAETLPLVAGPGSRLRLLAGSLLGASAPVDILSDIFCADVELDPDARFTLPPEHEERGVYVLSGAIELDGGHFADHRLLVLRPGRSVVIAAPAGARLLLLGGAPLDAPRHIWWNFVSSSTARIEQAKRDWKAGSFPPVPGETEFIPLPE